MIQKLSKAQVLRRLRTVHTWLGVLVVPWIIIIGATGFYLNHSKTILSMLEATPYDEARFSDWPGSVAVDRASALAKAVGIWPEEPVLSVEGGIYHDKNAYIVSKKSGKIIVTGVVAWTPGPLISDAVCSLEDAVNAAQVQRRSS